MEEINLIEVLSYFKSRLSLIISVVLMIVFLGNIYSFYLKKPMYQSNTTVLLVSETTNNFSEVQLNKNLTTTYTEIIKSRRVLNQVIRELNSDYTIDELTKQIGVEAVGDTQLIRISVKNSDKEKAALIADQIATTFTKEIKELYHLENVSIVDKAIINNEPYNINYIKDNIIYFAIGLVIMCGVVFIMYYFDTTIKSSDVIENKVGLTVIGIVPEEKNRG